MAEAPTEEELLARFGWVPPLDDVQRVDTRHRQAKDRARAWVARREVVNALADKRTVAEFILDETDPVVVEG